MKLGHDFIKGKSINLRPVTVDDADFILKLRTDPALNRYLNKTEGDVAKQVAWIEKCLKDEGQFYFVIEDKEHRPVGTIRVYDLKPRSFSWGSWIIQPDAPRKTAIESALLIYKFGFYKLGFENCHFDVRKENVKVIHFHTRYGAKIVSETEQDYFFNFSLKDYEAIRDGYRDFLPSEQ